MTVESGTIYYRKNRNSDELGPIGQQDLEELLSRGALTRQTEIRREGSSVWIRLSRFLNISDANLPDGNQPNVSDLAHLLDEFVIESAKAPAPVREQRWYCRVLGKEVGPIEIPVLRQMAEQGQISSTDRVRREGEAKWVLADSIPGIFEGIAASKSSDLSSAASSTISPQRFSKFVPKSKPPQADPPAPEATPSPAPKPQSSPASTVTTTPSPSTAEPTPSPPRPAASTPSSVVPSTTRSSMPGSSVSNSAYASLRKASYPPPTKKPSRDWSFSFPDLSDSPAVPITVGIVLLAGLGWLGYSTGFVSSSFNQVAGWFGGEETVSSTKADLVDDPNF